MNRRLTSTLSLTLGVLFLAGCVTGSLPDASAPSTSPSSGSSTEGDTNLSEDLRKIAKTSCDKAYEEGVTERVEGSEDRLVLLPVSYLYNDFFAAVVNDDGGVEPIWSTEVFSVCIDHINFLMAEESDAEYELLVSGDLASGNLKSEYQVADYGTVVTDYIIQDNVFVEVRTKTPDTESVTVVEYGIPSEADIESFREAIDLFLASQ
jgi:hypothetical protein